MTGREQLNRRKRWAAGGALAGVALIVAGVVGLPLMAGAGVAGPAMAAAVVPGVLVFVVVVVLGQQYLFRCPWCRGNMGPLMTNSGWWRMNPKVRFCPYCGTDLDDPVGAADWDAPVE
ncbi:MAG TPA: hypothetical protein VD866_12590 [Urbifossiella sp.]|nr:hypothetical protein [Urbifossiella sp.]